MQTGTDRANDVGALVGAVIQRMWKPMFRKHQATWDREALMVRGLELADVAVRTFNAGKGAQLSTWISLVVWRGLKTEHRTCEREAARNRTHGETRQYLSEGRRFDDVDETLPLSEWAGAIYRQAVQTVGKYHQGRAGNGGARGIEPAQEAALLAIKNRLKLSNRGVISFLSDRQDVVRSIRLKHLPHYTKFTRMWCRLAGSSANKRHRRSKARMAKEKAKSALICESEAASMCGVSPITLRGRRLRDDLPFKLYRPFGLVRYDRAEVGAYVKATSEAVPTAEGAKVA